MHKWCPILGGIGGSLKWPFKIGGIQKLHWLCVKNAYSCMRIYAMATEKFLYLSSLGWLLQEYNFWMGCGFQVSKFYLKISLWEEKQHNYFKDFLPSHLQAGIDLTKRKSDMHFFELQVETKKKLKTLNFLPFLFTLLHLIKKNCSVCFGWMGSWN